MRQISNFHTHTELCHHAKGSPAEYYEQAVKESCLALGFSDHCPYLDSFFDYWPNSYVPSKPNIVHKSFVKVVFPSEAVPITSIFF